MSFLRRLFRRSAPPTEERVSLDLTPDEASTLYLAARLLETYAEGRRASEAARLQAHIAPIIPPPLHDESLILGEVIGALHPPHHLQLDDPRLLALQQAIHQRRVVKIMLDEPDPEPRTIEPYALRFSGGIWLIDGYSRDDDRKRALRVSRIRAVDVLAETFAERFSAAQPPRIEVRVRFEPAILMQVRDSQHPAFRKEEPALGQRSRVMVYEIAAFDEILRWLLSWGAEAEVIEPDALRSLIVQEAQRIIQRLGIIP